MTDSSTERFSPGLPEAIKSLAEGKVQYTELTAERRGDIIRFFTVLQESDTLGTSIFCFKLFMQLGGQPETVIGIIGDLVGEGVDLNQAQRRELFTWLEKVKATSEQAVFAFVLTKVPEALRKAYAGSSRRLPRGPLLDGK